MEEELLKINHVLDDFYAGKLKDRNQLIKEWISFLDVLTEACKEADDEQKEHYRKNLSSLANKLAKGMLILTEESGVSDGELVNMVENPNNFDADAWNELNELKAKLDQRMKIILPLLLEDDKKKPPPPTKKAPPTPKKEKSRLSDRRRKRRSGWMPS